MKKVKSISIINITHLRSFVNTFFKKKLKKCIKNIFKSNKIKEQISIYRAPMKLEIFQKIFSKK